MLQGYGDAVVGLVGAIVGALLGAFGSYWIWWLEKRRQRKIARMQVVINLRQWLRTAVLQMCDVQTWVGSQGVGGTLDTAIKDFPFEQSLETVARLEDETAVKLFKMIRKKDAANSEVASEFEYGDDDFAVDIWRGRCAQVWLRALAIYEQISAQIGWADRPFDGERSMMKEEAGRLEKLKQQRDKAQAKLLKSINVGA